MIGDDWVAVGQIVAPHGIGGLCRVQPLTDFPERLPERKRLFLRSDKEKPAPIRVISAAPHGRVWLFRLEGVTDRDAAERLRGFYLVLPAEELPPLPEGEYYHHQLLGLRVETTSGEFLGECVRVETTAANDVYVVRLHPLLKVKQRELLLPAIKEVIRDIDLDLGIMRVRLMEGMLEGWSGEEEASR